MKNIRGMSLQLLRLVMQAGICSIVLLILTVQISHRLISKCFTRSELEHKMTEHRVENLMDYVADHHIAATDYIKIQQWCDKQPMVFMEIYRDNYLIFNSIYTEDTALSDQNIEINHYAWYAYYELDFEDGKAELFIYSDESYVLMTMAKIMALILSAFVFICIVLHGIRKIISYIYLLTDEILVMGSGDLNHEVTIKGENELTLLANGLEQTRKSLLAHIQKEDNMIRQNREMITSLSHDLRTPLTKIMLCVEIIQSQKYRDEKELNDYLRRTYNSSLQLKTISEHLLQYALSHEDIEKHKIRTIAFRQAFYDELSEMIDYFAGLGIETACNVEWYDNNIQIIDLNVRRILDNIVSNIEKYADRQERVTIQTAKEEGYAGLVFRNKKMPMNNLEGHHVGLNNMQTLMTEMRGRCIVTEDEDYQVKLLFRLSP